MKKLFIGFFLISAFGLSSAEAALQTKTIEYKDGEVVLEGYLAYDDALPGKLPGILVIHDWSGVGSYTMKRAEQLAGLGYVAFAPDIYGKGIRPTDVKDKMAQITIYKSDRALMRRRVLAGFEVLKNQPNVDATKLAAIGYCFGGTCSLELARSGAELNGVVSFHGGLDTPNLPDAKNIKAKILVLHGADDPWVPADQVAAFEKEMREGNVDYQIISYGGAVHAFTVPDAGSDPSTGAAYNDRADRRSWENMKQFLGEILT